MPAIPNTWLNDFVTNVNPNGSQGDPVVTQLASGHILVVWTDFDSSSVPGSPAGSDIIGRIFDSQGNAVTAEFRLNTRNTGDSETNPSIAATADGGFVVVYDETGGTFDDLNLQTYSFNPATGVVTAQDSIDVFFDGGDPNPVDYQVASSNANSIMTVYHVVNADGSDDVFVRHYNPTTNTLAAPVQLLFGVAGAGEDVGGVGIDVLTNGNYVVTYINKNAAADTHSFQIFSAAGAFVTSGTIDNVGEMTDTQVTALSGGGFAVAWSEGTNIYLRAYNSAGVAENGVFLAEGSANSLNEPVIVSLANNGFIILWDDDTTGEIRGSHFGISGGSSVFTVALDFLVDNTGGAAISEIEASDLGDGRFVVTWSENGNIRTKIMDTRDFVNGTPVYTPESQQVGTIGNDTFTAEFGADQVFGHDGNDTITESGIVKEYYGGSGNDTLIVVSPINDDLHDGGSGTDTIDWSLSGVIGATFNLNTGLATAGGQDEVMTSFENLIGTENADTIIGSGGGNVLSGLGGNDLIYGGFSTDTIDGGSGNDVVYVLDGEFGDNVNGGAGADDTYNFEGLVNYRVIVNLATGTSQIYDSGGVAFGPANTVVNVENVRGGGRNDHITGDAADNDLAGVGGNDTLVGGLGNDNISGGVGNDYLSGQDGNDTLDGNTGNDNMFGGNGNDTMNGGDGADYISANAGNDVINGSIGTDTIFGGGDRDIISGGDQADTIYGQAGDDNLGTGLSGNGGNDMVNGGGGNDLINGHDGQDQLYGSSGNDVINGGNGNDLLHGGTDDDTLNGQGHDDTMYGYHGTDTLNGGDGNDTMNGGDGNDTLRGGNGNDVLIGADGNDQLRGDAGTDRFNFDDGWGNDTIQDFANNGLEKINLAAVAGINNIGDLAIANSGGGALITFGANTIHVLGVTAAQLDNSDFIF